MKAAIRRDAASLRQFLAQDSSRADELIRWGEKKPCFTYPFHFISDMSLKGTAATDTLPLEKEVPLVDVLLTLDMSRSMEFPPRFRVAEMGVLGPRGV